MRMVRRETTTWTRSPLWGADPLLLVLALCATLVTRLTLGTPRRSGTALLRPESAAPLTLSGHPAYAARAYRRSVPAPVAVLALTTLTAHWCWNTRRRLPLAALAAASLVGQLALTGEVPWPVRVEGAAGVTAFMWREAVRVPSWPDGLSQLPQLPALPRIEWPSFLAPARSPHATEALTGAVEGEESYRSTTLGAAPTGAAAPAARSARSPMLTEAAAPAVRAAWQPSGAATALYPERIEAWRPLVRELLAEAWQEGRLDGPASRLDDDLVLALVRQESGGNPDALSWAGAMGLMQVMPFTFAEMMHGDRALTCAIDRAAMWDVRSNARAGLRYLALAMQAHEGNLYWALASYNAGIETVHDWRAAGLYAVPPIGGYTETAAYAPAILRDYLRRRPDVAMYVPANMVTEHVAGAIRLLRDLDASRPPRTPEVYPRCASA